MHKGTDNIHHAIGDLVVIPKEMQWKLYEQVEQELAAWRMNPTVILAPLPRYLESPCCNLDHHMTNMKKEDHRKKMEAEVYKMRTNLKDFAFRKGRRNATTISTWGVVKRLDKIWADPVHLHEDGYFAISEAVVEAVAGLAGKRRGSEAAPPAAKRKRCEGEQSGERALGQQQGRGGIHGGQGHDLGRPVKVIEAGTPTLVIEDRAGGHS
jgi:hypothetical protein